MNIQDYLFAEIVRGWSFMLFYDCLEEFQLDCTLRKLSIRTVKGYYNNIRLFLTFWR